MSRFCKNNEDGTPNLGVPSLSFCLKVGRDICLKGKKSGEAGDLF